MLKNTSSGSEDLVDSLPRLRALERSFDQYSSLPKEAILKQDILREGLAFSPDSLRIAGGYKPKDYFIFSFDLVPISGMSQEENLRAPEEIKLQGGRWELLETVVSVRVNPDSPYSVRVSEGELMLFSQEDPICGVTYHPRPAYYSRELSSSKPISEIAPVIEWGYLIYLTVYRLCQYFNREEQCQFCDLNANYRQQKQSGRVYTGIKSVEEIAEALEHIREMDQESQAITITGGAVIDRLRGETEIEFYSKYARMIREKFSNRWILKAVVQAFEIDECRQLKDSGFEIYHPNFEVWDPILFEKICPGKTRVIGRDGWIDRVVQSAAVFGPENVIPNFVGGVEMNRNFGFCEVDQAVDSTGEGLEFFMSRGIMPRFTTWCPEPYAKLGPQPAPPLDYFCKLLIRFRDIFQKYNLQEPRGYGPTGVGKAVFSVSAFMDVL